MNKKEFTRDNLKDGNMCKTRNGEVYMWLNGILYCESYGGGLRETTKDLKNRSGSEWDIVQVRDSKARPYSRISHLFEFFDKLPIIWEREVVEKDVSIEEINTLLKEKYPDVDVFNLPLKDGASK